MRRLTASRTWRLATRLVAAAVSLAVVAVTAFGWVQLRALDHATPAAAVIAGPTAPPTAEQNILLVGLDTRTDAQGNPLPPDLLGALHAGSSGDGGDTADTLIVVHVPAGGGRATAVSIPRDSYVDLAEGLGRHKINSAYSRAYNQALTDGTASGAGGGTGQSSGSALHASDRPLDPAVVRAAQAAAARATIETVEGLTNLHITHYAAINLAGFADLSRAIGGVSVCLRAPVDDPYSGAVFPAGPQSVSGPQALAFVRQRHGLPNGDLDRIARQQTFLAAATERLLAGGTLANPFALSRLSSVLERAVTLDAGWDVLGFARQLQGLSAGAVTFRTIPTGSMSLSTPQDGTAVQVTPATVRAFVAQAIAADAGLASGPSAVAATRPSPVSEFLGRAVPRPVAPAAPRAVGPSAGDTDPIATTDPATDQMPDRTTGAPASSDDAHRDVPITAAAPGCVN